MAHFAEIQSSDNQVLRVVVISNDDVNNNGGELSTQAETFVKNLFKTGDDTYWKQCSYSGSFRKNHAGVGGYYKPTEDVFHDAQPSEFSSWVLNTTTYRWEPPIAHPGTSRPNDGEEEEWTAIWNEDLWNSSGHTNGWTSMQPENVPDRDTKEYYYDQATSTWSVKND